MGYFPVRYDFRVINYNRRGFIRLATGYKHRPKKICSPERMVQKQAHFIESSNGSKNVKNGPKV